MSLDLAWDDAQEAIGSAVSRFCADHEVEAIARRGDLPLELWRGLAELGVLGLASADGEGGTMELVAALEALGREGFPGPLAATFFATQVLPADDRRRVSEGEVLVSLGAPPLLPWAPRAGLFLELDGERVYRAQARGCVQPVDTLGAEPWGRVALEREQELDGGLRAHCVFDVALAALLAASGCRLVEAGSEYARARRQFGRAIGEFQAVAHPLADCAIRLEAATALARFAAEAVDADASGARVAAAAARLSAGGAALEASAVVHQVFGAVGITTEGPIFHITRHIRQLASLPPGEAAARRALVADLDPEGEPA
ncbi:MAG: acyl-CoA dehydrogenase family protein [Myxococcota bacterium]